MRSRPTAGIATSSTSLASTTARTAFSSRTVMLVYRDLAVMALLGGVEGNATERARHGGVRRPRCRGYRVEHIVDPGTLDGGDVLKVGATIYVGLGGANERGCPRPTGTRTWSPLGATVVGVPVTKVLHLKSAVTALPDGTVIGYLPLVDDRGASPQPSSAGARGARLPRRPARRSSTLLMASSALRGRRRCSRSAGYRPVARRHRRVREARGLCDLLVGTAAL